MRNVGYVDAYGTIQYFNASKILVNQGDTIELTCGATLEEDGEFHSLVVHIRKQFAGSQEWLLSVNEDIEYTGHQRYLVEAHRFDEVRQFDFTILSKNFKLITFCVQKSDRRKYRLLVCYCRYMRRDVPISNCMLLLFLIPYQKVEIID